MSIVRELHVPVIPFCDVVGKIGTLPPEQTDILFAKPKVGVTFGLTVTFNCVCVAHWPAKGVNV